MSYVYDSSAMVALLNDESGAGVVEECLAEDVPHHAHAVNLCEVFYGFLRVSQEKAEGALADVRALGIVERSDLDEAFWRDVAALVAKYRSGKGNRLALGDAFGLAFARRLDADFVTADRGELETVAADGTARIIFIR